jgi:photosystem II stability/assembly factor-like uncharacterized protein
VRQLSGWRALLVSAVFVGAVSGWSGGLGNSFAGPGRSTTTSSAAAPTGQASQARRGPAGRPVPAQFNPESFTAISASSYWVLGRIPCRAGRCFAILRTTDGGRSFVRIPAPALPAEGTVRSLRFADRLDGFAIVAGVGGVAYATHDGGATWKKLPLRTVLAFATGGGNAYAVTARCSLADCTGYRFERSPASAERWRATPMQFAPDGSVFNLATHGSSVWLLGTPAGSRSMRRDVLVRSTDGGRTFVTGPGPCYPGLGGQLAPTSATVVWAVCPGGMLARAARSTDGGIRFTQLSTPPLVNSAVVAPATEDTAVVAGNGAGLSLRRTTDGGATWTTPRVPGRAIFVSWIGFTDAHVGAALVQIGFNRSAMNEIQVLWRTTDSGAHWSAVRFR